MSIIQSLIKRNPSLRAPERLACHLPFIEYDKDTLMSIQAENNNYMWYYDWLSIKNNRPVDSSRFSYKFLPDSYINQDKHISKLTDDIRKQIPLLYNIQFDCQFVKFDNNYTLEVHVDSGRNAAIFFPLTDDSSPTDFYRNGKKIGSIDHTMPLLAAVDCPHGSQITKEKITFQVGFYYPDWHELLDYCVSKNKCYML
jgi:hypothetical protein